MTFDYSLGSILADDALRRREFPVAENKAFFAHAAVCPLATCVASAISTYLDAVNRGGQFDYLHAQAEAGSRAIAAELIGADPSEIAFVPSTSAGLGLIAAGLAWEAGDSVVFAEGDFPSNVLPWEQLAGRGVRAKAIPARGDGSVTREDVMAQLDDRTRLVALSSVHFATGARIDLDAIGSALASRGVLFCVDAIQSLGALPTPARHVDFMVADAHKWLLGPQGMGILFVRRTCFEVLSPPLLGWKSLQSQKDFVQRGLELADTARRYEPGSLNALGLVGLHAALTMLQRVGLPAIASQLAALRAYLAPRLIDKGYELLGPSGAGASASLLSFRREGVDMPALYRTLDGHDVITSLRHDPRGRQCVRVAPHFYNTTAELDRLLALV
jgi:cysteine desulfurase/selenocysteine lyase